MARGDSHHAKKFIVGLDGEGCGRKPHLYTLLAWSSSDGKCVDRDESQSGLSSERCLSFLLRMPKAARPFGYFLPYDWTMILRDLPDPLIYRLLRPETRALPKNEGSGFSYVCWKPKNGRVNYRLHYLAGMMRIARGDQSVTIWDVGKFFQCTFVKALEDWNIGTPEERASIAAMKAKRSQFSKKERSKILAYCLTECRLLADLVAALNAGHERAGLKLKSWHGPGSTATGMLKQMGIAKKRGDIPPEVEEVANRAFFGGRFEHSTIGEVKGPIYAYDIISAYPAECVKLPCLEHGKWEYTTKEKDLEKAEHACVRYTLKNNQNRGVWAPLPCRLADGTIVFPRSGATGWVWRDEFFGARAWSQVYFVGAWRLLADCGCRPFARIREWFNERNRVGRKSGVGFTLKLGYNSCYGKLAQCVGNPPFASRIWAGMITSGCRAKLLAPLYEHDADVLAVATDGIYSRVPIPSLQIGEGLGEWEATDPLPAITLVRPGIYWTAKTRRARGLGRQNLSLAETRFLQALESRQDQVRVPGLTRFGGAMACVYSTSKGELRRSPQYGEWFEYEGVTSLSPRPKRTDGFGLWDLPGVESAPYKVERVSPDAQKLKKAAISLWGNR